MSNMSAASHLVGIYRNGELIEKIDLNCVTEEREIVLTGDSGKNTILVSHGHIKMKCAECPDKLCVKHGELESGGSPIVCLPNKVVIKFEDETDTADAKAGAAG